jgi:hypothetical protein
MAKKQVTSTQTATAAAPARAAKPRTPRVTKTKHSKSAAAVAVPAVMENPQEAISKIAYGYWVARGFQPGNPTEDWLRAEQEYLTTL